MNFQTVAQAKEDLIGLSHSFRDLNKVKNVNRLFKRAAGNVVAKLDPNESIRVAELSTPLYDQQHIAVLPTDLKKEKIIDIRPVANQTLRDNFAHVGSKNFWRRKNDNTYAIKYDDGVRTLAYSKALNPASEVVHEMDSLTDDGTWATTGLASNLRAQAKYYLSGTGALEFDVTGAGGGIATTNMGALDLTALDELGDFLLPIYFPTAYAGTISAKWGNDVTTKFFADSASAQLGDTAFSTGWNIVQFMWDGAAETGAVDPAAINSFELTFSEAISNVRVDSIVASLGALFDIEYYSNCLFRSTAGTYIDIPTASDDSDLILMDTEAYNIFLFELLEMASQQMQGEDAQADMKWSREQLHGIDEEFPGLYKLYKKDSPSRAQKKTQSYYKTRGNRR